VTATRIAEGARPKSLPRAHGHLVVGAGARARSAPRPVAAHLRGKSRAATRRRRTRRDYGASPRRRGGEVGSIRLYSLLRETIASQYASTARGSARAARPGPRSRRGHAAAVDRAVAEERDQRTRARQQLDIEPAQRRQLVPAQQRPRGRREEELREVRAVKRTPTSRSRASKPARGPCIAPAPSRGAAEVWARRAREDSARPPMKAS